MVNRLVTFLNNISLKSKLRGLYIICVICPLVLTDGVIISGIISSRKTEQQNEMQNVAAAVENGLTSQIDRVEYLMQNIYLNQYLYNYLNKTYESPADYYTNYSAFMNSTFFLGNPIGVDRTQIIMYADNPTIVNGGRFRRLETAEGEKWYQDYLECGKRAMLSFYYDDRYPLYQPERKILLVTELDYFSESGVKKILRVEMNYSNLVKYLNSMNFSYPVYICQRGKVLLSNAEANNTIQDFYMFSRASEIAYTKRFTLYDQDYQIYVLRKPDEFLNSLQRMFPFMLILILLNVALPWIVMNLIERSITVRIKQLDNAFRTVEGDRIEPIECVYNKDEIGRLMTNYNRMVDRMNDLIQTVYKDKLHEQNISIAKQKAELLALHSQINPHFLFNALESIRMHSVLKEEEETADMIQNLAVMERQYVDWGNDSIEIKQELEFAEAYLRLQKYRFGNRLSYELDIEEDCENFLIPKLTIVTFVENACVHGIESKSTPGWLFVRVYQTQKSVCIEVEDTGGGIEENKVRELNSDMQNACIGSIQKKKSVGIQNACLRIKMATDNTASFSIESEAGIGTLMQIQIPIEKMVRKKTEE